MLYGGSAAMLYGGSDFQAIYLVSGWVIHDVNKSSKYAPVLFSQLFKHLRDDLTKIVFIPTCVYILNVILESKLMSP